jgi:hypothetical protein
LYSAIASPARLFINIKTQQLEISMTEPLKKAAKNAHSAKSRNLLRKQNESVQSTD